MKSNIKKIGFYLSSVASVCFVLFLTYDIIITNILSAYYCNTAPNPKTKIEKKVEYPISIYWEDNVYPGFSKEDRELMIMNYLDGIHLKKMALNGDDGKVYIYTKEVPKKEYLKMSNKVSNISKEIKKLQTFPKDRQNKQYIKNINKLYKEKEALQNRMQKLIDSYPVEEKEFSKDTMPKMNYTVTFNEIKLNSFTSKFLYSDETKVIENNTGKVIAYNQRYMRFFYTLHPDIALGNRYYWQEPMCGDWWYGFDENVLIGKWSLNSFGYSHHNISPNEFLYNKYIKGEN